MNKIIAWLKDSHRWQHLLLAFLCGLFAKDWYCTLYGGVGVAGALEFKDYLWGGKPDVIDFALTVAGFCLGHLLVVLLNI